MVHKINLQREKLREAFIRNNIDLNKVVNFWGMKIPLGEAINKMDKDDIKDGYKMIEEKALPDFPTFVMKIKKVKVK